MRRKVVGAIARLDGTPWINTSGAIVLSSGSFNYSTQYPSAILRYFTDSQGYLIANPQSTERGIYLWCNEEGDDPSKYTWILPDGRGFDFVLPVGSENIELSVLREGGDDATSAKYTTLITYFENAIEEAIAQIPGGDPNATKTIKIPFNWGDATPKTIASIPANKSIIKSQITIETVFDSANSFLSLGDVGNPQRLIQSISGAIATSYRTFPMHTYLSSTDVLLTISLGAGNTQGKGFVVLEF